MHLYKVSSLKCLSEYRLSDVLFLLLQNNSSCRKSIEEYCEVLKSIGNFNLVSELTLDRLAESEVILIVPQLLKGAGTNVYSCWLLQPFFWSIKLFEACKIKNRTPTFLDYIVYHLVLE